MDKLDTGVLICHLARIIQSKAKDVVVKHGDGQEDSESDGPAAAALQAAEEGFQEFCTIYNGISSSSATVGYPDSPPNNSSNIQQMKKQAQQYLQQLLRGAHSRETLLAAAKVFIYILHIPIRDAMTFYICPVNNFN